MFRKALTIIAIGISVLAAGALKSEAQGFVTHVHINGWNAAAGYLIWDVTNADGSRGVTVAYNDGKGVGTAYLPTISTATFGTGGAVYSGTMSYTLNGGKKAVSYGFTMTFDAATHAIAFTLTKNGATVVSNAAAALDPSSLIVFNP